MTAQGIRILLIEDEALVSILIEDVLCDLDYQIVATAARLEPALEKAATLAFDLAILDVNLDGKMSYPVAEVLRARMIPFIFVTGYGMAGLPDELGAVVVLPKPFRRDQLAAALQRATRGIGVAP